MGSQLTVPSGSSWYLDDFNSNHLKNPESIFDGTFNLSFRAEEKQEPVAVKAIQLSGKDGRSIAQTFFNIYYDKSKIISRTKSGNLISTPILTKNAAYLIRPFIDMPITERIAIDPPLENFEKKWIAFQLLHAIRNLHKITIFHGDIKPENVLVDPNLTVHLTDHAPFKPQYISQNQPHYFIHFFSYGRPSAYIAPERISRDLSTNPELQKEQTNRAILAIQAITESLQQQVFTQIHTDNIITSTSNDNLSNQGKTEDTEFNTTEHSTEKVPQNTINNTEALEALHFMQAADLFSIGCVLAFIFTGGKSLFDFTSLVQYGLSKDDSPLKILDKIDDDKMRKLILNLIDRDQKRRIEAISHFEDSFPMWMNELYLFYIDKIVDTPVSKLPSIFCLDKVSQIFPFEIHDEILIYLNIISDFFSQKLKISRLSFFIRHFEQFSLRVSSVKLKIVRLIPPLLFLLQRESSTISLLALDSVISIIKSIDTIENEEDEIVKNFCDVFFIPQLVNVMDPKRKENNEKIVIISHIPVILAEFGRLWPSIFEKLPMRTEFIIPMLQYGGNSPVDQTKLMIVRHFLASAKCVTFTKSYPVFRALYRILFQMLNCPVYVPLIVEFVKEFLNELNHVDKIRFYSELFAPFQGAVLSYASTFTKSETADDILIIFDAFATMIEGGELKNTSYTAIANAAYKHITSFQPSSRVAARVLLKKLPLIYQKLDIIPIVSPQPQPPQPQISQPIQQPQQQPQQPSLSASSISQSAQNLQPPIPIQKVQRSTFQSQQQMANLSQSQQNVSKSIKASRKKGKKGNKDADDANIEFYETTESFDTISSSAQINNNGSSANSSNESLSMYSNTASINNSGSLGQNMVNSSENEISMNNNVSMQQQQQSSSQQQQQQGQRQMQDVPKMTPTKHYYSNQQHQQQQQHIKTHLYSSTKIGSSKIEKILIVHDKVEDNIQSIVLHSKSTVVCYYVNIHPNQSRNNGYQNGFDSHKIIEQSWIYTYPKPVLNFDVYKVKNESGLIITFPDSIIRRSRGRSEKILDSKKPFAMCKMVNDSTIAFSDGNLVVCRDLCHNFELKGSYRIEKEASVTGIYSWHSMGDNFFAISSSRGRIYAIDQRTNVPIFTTCEHKGMSDVVLLPHFAYAVTKWKKDMDLYRYSPFNASSANDDFLVKDDSGGYSSKPTFQLKGRVDSMMSVSNSLLLLNQYGTFMLDNMGTCFSLSDKNRVKILNHKNGAHFLNRLNTATVNRASSTELQNASAGNIVAAAAGANSMSTTRHRSTTLYDVNKMALAAANLAKSDANLAGSNARNAAVAYKTPVVNLPVVGCSSLHGHTFQVSACANYNNGAICMSGDCAGYLNVWSAIHPRSEFV